MLYKPPPSPGILYCCTGASIRPTTLALPLLPLQRRRLALRTPFLYHTQARHFLFCLAHDTVHVQACIEASGRGDQKSSLRAARASACLGKRVANDNRYTPPLPPPPSLPNLTSSATFSLRVRVGISSATQSLRKIAPMAGVVQARRQLRRPT